MTLAPADRQSIYQDLERVRVDLHNLVAGATAADLRRGTTGTRWTNGQMLWHMAFGFLIVCRLLPLVRLFGRLPDAFGRIFAAVLNAATRPFHVINYLGSVGGAVVFHGPRLTRQIDHTIDVLHRRLDALTEEALARRMHFPVGGDPFFGDIMTLEQVYRYGVQHYDFHRAQLTSNRPEFPVRTVPEHPVAPRRCRPRQPTCWENSNQSSDTTTPRCAAADHIQADPGWSTSGSKSRTAAHCQQRQLAGQPRNSLSA